MLTSDTKRPATVFVLLNQDCRYGKKGDKVQFSGFRAQQVVEAGYGTEIADEAPRRAQKMTVENKSVGA